MVDEPRQPGQPSQSDATSQRNSEGQGGGRTSDPPVRVAVTGAAGQIAYSLLFKLANGSMLGQGQPLVLQLLEIPEALNALKGVVMELQDCAFPLLAGVTVSSDPVEAFGDAEIALLVGARPRAKGMERRDLLEANGAIFTVQGKALAGQCKARRTCSRGGQPCQHKLSDRCSQRRARLDASSPRAVCGNDPARPQPGGRASSRSGRGASGLGDERGDLGQPLGHAVPGHLPRQGRAAGRPSKQWAASTGLKRR